MARLLSLDGEWSDQPPTIIVSGLPRSGTSMMMQMLDAGGVPILSDGVREADIDNPRGYLELEAVKRTKQDPSWLLESAGKAVKIVYSLLFDLPTDRPYRVIMMRRKTEVVVNSQAAMLARLGQEGADLPPDKLARVYEQQLERAADYLTATPCFAALEVWYGAVIEFPESQIERLNGFLSGELDTVAMINTVDPTLRRQRAP